MSKRYKKTKGLKEGMHKDLISKKEYYVDKVNDIIWERVSK